MFEGERRRSSLFTEHNESLRELRQKSGENTENPDSNETRPSHATTTKLLKVYVKPIRAPTLEGNPL